MSIHARTRFLVLIQLALLPALSGCSILGFSAYPVAHVMTDDTKDVLAATPSNVNVARELSKEVQANHFLQPGDELLLETVGDGRGSLDSEIRLPADQQVMTDGSIDLGQFGRVVVAGMTLEQAETSIQRIIHQHVGQSKQVNLRLIQPIHRYYVIGEVNSPGAYPMTGHETVLDAIMEAGGLTARASACDLLLARPTAPRSCRVTLPVCYRAITQLGDTTTNYHLKPGDRIFVSRQSLCEEVSAYVRGGKTCRRCCKSQAACCDPRLSTPDLSAFVDSGIEWIKPTDPPNAKAPEATSQPGGESLPPESLPPNDLPPLSVPEQADERADEQVPDQASPLDGELDFSMLLR